MSDGDIIKALDLYFNRENPPKFLNTSRIPLICQDISIINKTLERIELGIKLKEDDHEDRLRKLESKQAFFSGASAIIGAFGGYILNTLLGKK